MRAAKSKSGMAPIRMHEGTSAVPAYAHPRPAGARRAVAVSARSEDGAGFSPGV